MEQLNGVAAASPPVLLWKGGGRFAQLFKFLAARFLANPDSVLDIERQHAVWQWVLLRRRAMKLKSMNAWLKLGQYLRGHDALPADEELQPYLRNIRAGERLAMAGVRGDDAIAPGARRDSLYWSRLNLSVSEAALLAADARDVAEPSRRTFEVAWSNYVRWTFVEGQFYGFETLRLGMYLYIAENKSLGGREGRAEGDAIGRPLTAAWFEEREQTAEGCLVRRADRTSPKGLSTMLVTLAELLHAAGQPYPDLAAEATARDKEIAMEEQFATVPRTVHEATHIWEDEDPWTFLLTEPQPAEKKYLDESPLENLTNMALARLLELKTGANTRLWYREPKRAILEKLAAP